MFEIPSHRSGPETGALTGDVVALRGGHFRISEWDKKCREPAPLQDDVLIDLADDRVCGLANRRVDRRRGAAAVAAQQPQDPVTFQPFQQPQQA